MKRELGSQAQVQVMGGLHDGALGHVVRVYEEAGQRVQVVKLQDGTMLEIATDMTSETMPREIGTDG